MWDRFQERVDGLARRAGLRGLPPSAVVAVGVVICLVVLVAAWRWWPRTETVAPVGSTASGASAAASGQAGGSGGTAKSSAGREPTAGSSAGTTVHVVGAVLHPGVYELSGGSRVADAVASAGGLTGNAAPAALNLARLLTDGEQIVVPTADDYAKAQAGSSAQVGSGAGAGVVSPGGASAENPGAPPAGSLVNINTADAAALDTLPGVGPSTAEKIVSDREANGPFASAADLGRVSGIGPKKLEQLKAYVSVQ